MKKVMTIAAVFAGFFSAMTSSYGAVYSYNSQSRTNGNIDISQNAGFSQCASNTMSDTYYMKNSYCYEYKQNYKALSVLITAHAVLQDSSLQAIRDAYNNDTMYIDDRYWHTGILAYWHTGILAYWHTGGYGSGGDASCKHLTVYYVKGDGNYSQAYHVFPYKDQNNRYKTSYYDYNTYQFYWA